MNRRALFFYLLIAFGVAMAVILWDEPAAMRAAGIVAAAATIDDAASR